MDNKSNKASERIIITDDEIIGHEGIIKDEFFPPLIKKLINRENTSTSDKFNILKNYHSSLYKDSGLDFQYADYTKKYYSVGRHSFAEGQNSFATGQNSFALGMDTEITK